ncbi:hypothetical protein [Pseudomonas fluorescens]|uniref:Uncharacterized protein n=1 Tax=Pseudomonas fluorescens TaxID=294 RepID=A0A5E6Q8D0_PSEFL|nr:hypothetical protein [Pseudomonas fluorescens]VVM52486.1 hypothetical protein PS655_00859 [Pseudomonas fluorescens]
MAGRTNEFSNVNAQLYPLKFLAGVSPITSDPAPPPEVPVVGLPHSAFTGLNATTIARVDPPMDEYIAVLLYLETSGAPLLIERKVPDDFNAPTMFDVAQSLFAEGLNSFYYVIERASGNEGGSTPSWALYNNHLPGGNEVPGSGDHPFLALSLPAELGNPPQIGKEDAANGVALTLSFPFGQPYDKVLLELNGQFFPVTCAEKDQPLVIVLTQTMLEQAGNNPHFEIRYTVISQVNNPTANRRKSAALIADVDLQRSSLVAPILREDPEDDSDDPHIIDRDELQGRDLSVIVLASAPAFQADDTVSGTVTVTPPGTVLPLSGVIESEPDGTLKRCIMQVANQQIITGSEVRAVYELTRAGVPVGRSNTATARVTGSGDLPGDGQIAAPGFPVVNTNGAIGLDQLVEGPEGLHNPVRVTLDYTHAAIGDAIELFFVGYDTLNIGGNPVPNAAYNPQPPYALTEADISRGHYDFAVPARHHFAVCSRGSVEAWIIASNASGSTQSLKKRVNCDVKKPGESTCPENF